jgi:hypothetical protein
MLLLFGQWLDYQEKNQDQRLQGTIGVLLPNMYLGNLVKTQLRSWGILHLIIVV